MTQLLGSRKTFENSRYGVMSTIYLLISVLPLSFFSLIYKYQHILILFYLLSFYTYSEV